MKHYAKIVAVCLVLFSASDNPTAVSASATNLRNFVCRISNQVNGARQFGSGTLIDKTTDGGEGLVLTCAHLFQQGVGEVLVRFIDGRRHHATLVEIDYHADLAALAIAFPAGEPVRVAHEVGSADKLRACGFGPQGVFRCAVGTSLGQAASRGQVSLLIGDGVRSGDSGGGVFDDRGRLVAVIWGAAQGVTYASHGKPLQSFLSRVLGRRSTALVTCPGGTCQQRPTKPARHDQNEHSLADLRWHELQQQLDQLRKRKQDRGDYLTRSELPDFETYARHQDLERIEDDATTRHASLLKRLQTVSGRSAGKALGTAVVGLLGLNGPAGWAVVAAASFGGWLVGRRMKKRLGGAGGRRRRRFRSKTASTG
ncbi:MAG: S1 family peptidase [Bythopirellula sp.]